MIRPSSITTKVILAVASLIIVFGVIAIITSYRVSFDKFSSTEEFSIDATVNQINRNFSQTFFQSQDLVKSLSTDQIVSSFFTSGTKTNIETVVNVLKNYNLGNSYSALYLLDKKGITVASTDPRLYQQDYHFRPYFTSAIGGTPYTDVNLGITTNTLGYYFSHPILQNEEVVGVAVIKIDPKILHKAVNSQFHPSVSDFLITDRYGVVIYSSKPGRIYHSLSELTPAEKKSIAAENKYPNVEIWPLQYQTVHTLIRQRITTTQSVNINDEVDKTEEKIIVSPVNNQDFYLISEVSLDSIAATSRQNAFFVSIIVLFAVLGAIITLSFILSHLLYPIKQLTDYSGEIGNGNFNLANPVQGNDEFAKLGNVMSTMARSLQNKYQELESLVAARTKQIADQAKNLEQNQLALLNLTDDLEGAATDLQKFRLAVENASDHMVITDPDGVVVYANRASQEITGFSLKEILGKKAGSRELWGGLMEKSFYQKMWQTIKVDKKTFSGEITNKRKNGQQYIAASSISPIIDSTGNPSFFVGIERDVTKAKEVDRIKTEFVSFASHQLRTPLTAMKWFAEMLLAGDAGKLNKEQIEFVQNIYNSNERMVALVKDLLDISRIESGRIIIEPKPTDLPQLINEIITEESVKIQVKKQQIIPSFNPHLPLVNLDPTMIRNVYLNLINNAIKYTPEGGEISVIVSREDDHIISQVTDTGLGIPPDQQSQVFQKFFRAANAVKLETEGSGLGLYLVKAIIESSGGKIWFTSVEGKGTTFWFTLPLAGVPAKAGQVRLGS